ncbi:MAG: hypothetical protein ACLFSE_03495 [Spirochaetia bacterium]
MIRKLIVPAILFFIAISSVSGLDLSFSYNMGNLDYKNTRAITETTFTGKKFPWGFTVWGADQVGSQLELEAGFTADPVLRNLAYSRVSYQNRFFTLGVGPFLGLFNSKSSLLKSGISTFVRVEWTGVLFFSVLSENTIGGNIIDTGDYSQERNVITGGFYVKNAICSLKAVNKRYTTMDDTHRIVDDFKEYSFNTDIHEKNVPFTILLSFAYQDRTKSFIPLDTTLSTVRHSLGSVIVGTQVTVHPSRVMDIVLDLESSVFTFGRNALLGVSGTDTYLFNAKAGIVLHTEYIGK